jgi:lysophospholipase L1-like esterase
VQVALGYYEWRNRVLGITTASARPVPESSYRASLEMIELALRYAQSSRIQVVLYLSPIRPIQPNPNLPSDVARFRRDVPALCRRYGVKCLDYLDLVPEALWTNYPDDAVGAEGQRDFAHFTGAAHKLLAEKLMADAGQELGSVGQEEKLSRR